MGSVFPHLKLLENRKDYRKDALFETLLTSCQDDSKILEYFYLLLVEGKSQYTNSMVHPYLRL